jgi:hypothetical protein
MAYVSVDGGAGILPQLEIQIDVTNAPTNTTRVWTSIVTRCRSVTFARSGRNDEFQRTSTGTATIVLDNRGDAITSLGVKKAQWVQILARWSATNVAQWMGIVTSAPRQWPATGHDATVTLQAADALYLLRLYDLGGQSFAAQRCDQRIAAICTLVGGGIAGTYDTQTDTIDATAQPFTAGSDALSAALAIEGSDSGLLIANANGDIDYQGRHWRVLNATSPVLTLDESTGVNYRDDVTYEDDDSRLANVVNVTPLGASSPQTASDSASQTLYWARHNQSVDRSLLSSSTALALSAAQYLVSSYRDPAPRIPAVTVDLARVGTISSANMLPLLQLTNSNRVTWQRAAASTITVDGYVEQVTHTITPGTSWTMQLQLSPATNEVQWVLGSSQLGITTGLAY